MFTFILCWNSIEVKVNKISNFSLNLFIEIDSNELAQVKKVYKEPLQSLGSNISIVQMQQSLNQSPPCIIYILSFLSVEAEEMETEPTRNQTGEIIGKYTTPPGLTVMSQLCMQCGKKLTFNVYVNSTIQCCLFFSYQNVSYKHILSISLCSLK